jgi:chromosome segregation ATPase
MEERTIQEIKGDVDRLTQKFATFESEMREMSRKIEELHREMGTRQGQDMFRQIDELHNAFRENQRNLNQIERDVAAIRSLVEYGDSNLKEIKQAIALIYRNTDELEEKLFPEDRDTR